MTDSSKAGPLRDQNTGNYLPDPAAEGPHTTLGIQNGRNGPSRQGATFDENMSGTVLHNCITFISRNSPYDLTQNA
jgi:hypothetical protein